MAQAPSSAPHAGSGLEAGVIRDFTLHLLAGSYRHERHLLGVPNRLQQQLFAESYAIRTCVSRYLH